MSDLPRIVVLAGGISSRMKSSLKNYSENNSVIEDARKKAKSMIRLGEDGRPFLDFLLMNISSAGYREVVIVVGQNDRSIEDRYSNNFEGMKIKYVEQPIPSGRTKPLGTSDALQRVLESFPNWSGTKFTVCNSDNLYSVNALSKLASVKDPNSFINYNRDALRIPIEKILKFAVTLIDDNNYLLNILEKPSPELVEKLKKQKGRIGVSMNLWRFSYDDILPQLQNTPLDPVRNEKEIPNSVKLLVKNSPGSVRSIPLAEHVPDLSSIEDVSEVQKYILSKNEN